MGIFTGHPACGPARAAHFFTPSTRRPVALAAAVLIGGATLLAAAPAEAQAQAQATYAKGRLLVMPRAGLSDAHLDKIVKANGGKKAWRVGKSDLHIVELPANASETAVLNRLAHNPHLKFAELDERVEPDLVANDAYLGSQWHVPKIGAPTAWDASQGAGITIAILDSGVLATHADLAAKLVPGWNFYEGNSNTADVTGHGTSVAGAAAATTNNTTGVAGIAGAAKIMPLRVSDATGYAYYSTLAQAVTFAADNGARVANASFAGVYKSASVQSAAQYLRGKGGLLTVSAGNAGTDDGSGPSTTMIPVSATDGNDAKSSFSSYGNYVAVAAPGSGIWTTASNGSYRSASGTSFSAPIAAGVIALMMAANPALSPAQVESLLYSTATDLGAAGRDIYFGHGRVNAAAAVAAAASAAAADTQAPTAAITSPAGSSSVSGLVTVDVSASDNVGVTRVELRVNGSTVASDTVAPYQFSWDSASVGNGTASLVAVAYDAAGNSRASSTVSVNVGNGLVADTSAPVVSITNPTDGSTVPSGNVKVSVSASDNSGAAAVKQALYIGGKLVASATGASLSYTWNTRKLAKGSYSIQAVAQDAAGNTASRTVTVSK